MKTRRSSKQREIEERWGVPFWNLVKDFADQDMSRRQTAEALGFQYIAFWQLLSRHPDLDPFPVYGVVRNYILDTGEGFRAAVTRLAKTYCMTEVAREIGYAGHQPFQHALARYGIKSEFRQP